MHRILLSKTKVLVFIRLILSLHIVPRIRYLGFTLDYDRGFVHLQVHFKFNTNIHRQHIIKGYHGQLIEQSQIMVRGRQSIDLKLGR
jgi:hypothetical protein